MDEVEKVLAARAPGIAALARRACTLALDVFPDAVVTADADNIGFGAGRGYRGLVFVVTPQRAHVTLGIARGVGLPDPAGLLEGAGKVHRHVKIRGEADLDRPELRALMVAAVSASQ
ncbi:DUF1801 domain-containing protein [Phytohabitans rumicis]|uniref:YdhG-like domain-containing protein n=1 Tax=Phytohabitans rumicis TaxID=1076125 RepID=A0A6V8LEL4_9ACTN|nr:DUF1801 domain-containing protein [Phytohabitans rumicis]GFJ95682.1 hypothetical protein Prum_093240 [Phytohabitans rumicis]